MAKWPHANRRWANGTNPGQQPGLLGSLWSALGPPLKATWSTFTTLKRKIPAIIIFLMGDRALSSWDDKVMFHCGIRTSCSTPTTVPYQTSTHTHTHTWEFLSSPALSLAFLHSTKEKVDLVSFKINPSIYCFDLILHLGLSLQLLFFPMV